MSVVLFLNLKGGVAKTTNAVAIAECLASSGKSTLVIDADHQCTATEVLLGEARMEEQERNKRTLHDLLLEMMKPNFKVSRFEAFVADKASNIGGGLEHLSVIPCSVRINDIATRLRSRYKDLGPEKLKSLLDSHRYQFQRWLDANFDYTIVDCPPSLSFQVKQLLQVSTGYVVPCQPNRLSLRGADWLCKKLYRDGFRRSALGTLWSMCRVQDSRQVEVMEKAKYGGFGDLRFPTPFDSVVPMRSAIAHAVDTVWEPAASIRDKYDSEFYPLFVKLANEIITRADEQGGKVMGAEKELDLASV